MKRQWAAKRSGFTLVELLIVIVVIAILTGISVVVFSGVQSRAKMASLVATIDAYQKGMELYNAENGGYPDLDPATGTLCLGVAGDLPATANYENEECGESDYTNVRNDSLNDVLEPYIGKAPRLSYNDEVTRDSSNRKFRGVMYGGDTSYYQFWYAVNLDTDCPVGEVTWTNAYLRMCSVDRGL